MKKLSKLMLGLGMTAMASSSWASVKGIDFKTERTDFRDETIYFAMTTRFYDGDPTNNVLCWDGQADQIKNNDPCWRGDFAGLIQKLPYLKALGFTAVWITPVVQNCSGFDYHGYHAMDFSRVDLRYESRREWGAAQDVKFQDLIDEAHRLDMKIILDIVLNHTGNFGEDHFAKLFERDQRISNQATPAGSLKVDTQKLCEGYFNLQPGEQFAMRFKYLKNTGGNNLDTHNYWHHYGYGNWDDPTRWWFQIAGDCVDLNTENDAVASYLVEQYGKFIDMGVDGFRIDTTGHIARLSFNTVFIPEFIKRANKPENQGKRLNGAPFFMFGECCARYSEVTYRGQPNLSCYYYTWDSPQTLKDQWNHDASWWDSQVIKEGDGTLYGNMALCEQEPSDQPTSDNAFMKNGKWHDPDYSKASNFWPIDFPVHYNFNSVGSILGNIKGGDKYYNDATYNVVYVDSHDYGPGPNDGIRFDGGTAQWAENLSFMFTMRGIPCLYYGSEVEFQKGKTIDKGPLMALAETGRAYYGAYLEGDVQIEDFGDDYTASGNVAKTLDGDLAQHIRRLNQIRAAVPALRKGQYTFDGCSASGGWAYKRAYKDESYALVAVNGGATFSSLPAGTYTEIVTGKKYTASEGGSITVDAPKNQGQLRVLVKDWKGEDPQVGVHGKFIYDTTPVAHGGCPSFSDPGTTRYYRNENVVGDPALTFNPAGGAFRTATQTVTVSMNSEAVKGWYQVGSNARVNITKGSTSTFTIGENMAFNETVKVSWGAYNSSDTEFNGELSYKKVDPNAAITVYIKADKAPNLYAWYDASGTKELNGAWPGKTLSNTASVNGETYYVFTVDETDSFNIIINNGNAQTANIEGITGDVYYEYDGGSGYKEIDVNVTIDAAVTLSPNGASFKSETLNVTATLNSAAVSGTYSVDGKAAVTLTPGTPATFSIGEGVAAGNAITVTWTAKDKDGKPFTGQATYTKVEPAQGITIYVKASAAPNLYVWDAADNKLNGSWPGSKMSDKADIDGTEYFYATFDAEMINIILNDGNGQTEDIKGIIADAFYQYNGGSSYSLIQQGTPAPGMSFSPNGGSFSTETLEVTATLNSSSVSGWVKPQGGSKIDFDSTTTFTIGQGVAAGSDITVAWSATNRDNVTKTGTVTFTKAAAHSSGISVYVLQEGLSKAPNIWAWDGNGNDLQTDAWPGPQMTQTATVGDYAYWCKTFDVEKLNFLLNLGDGCKTPDYKDVTADIYVKWNGTNGTAAQKIDDPANPNAVREPKNFTVYFDNSEANWQNVHIYSWQGDTKHLGEWSASPKLTETHPETGYLTYTIPHNGNDLTGSQVIFHNNSGTQTKNLDLVDGGVYNHDGFTGVTVGVKGVKADGLTIDTADGVAYITSPDARTIEIVTGDGRRSLRKLQPGLNVITDLPKGFYVVAGKKVLL